MEKTYTQMQEQKSQLEVMAFTNDLFGSVRAVKIDDEVWFVGRDVVEDLDYDLNGNSYTKYIKRFCDEEDTLKLNKSKLDLFGIEDAGRKGETLINEYAVIDLVLQSPLPQAKQFKRWITHEVIPSVLETGSYNVPQISKKQQCVLTIFDDSASLDDKVRATETLIDISRGEICNSVINLEVVEDLIIETLKDEEIINHMSRLTIREAFHKTLFRLGYITYKQFPTKDGKRLERVYTKVPTESFNEVFRDSGMAVVRDITGEGDDNRGKVEIKFTKYIVKWLHTEQFKETYLKVASSMVILPQIEE